MLDTIWDIYQAHHISELSEKVGNVQASRTQDNVARHVAFGLEEKVDKLALICRALFELVQEVEVGLRKNTQLARTRNPLVRRSRITLTLPL